MKKTMKFLEFCQLYLVLYLIIDLFSIFDMRMAIILFICFINVLLVSIMRSAQLMIERGNLALYRDFAKRLGWEDIVSGLSEVDK